MFDKISRLSEAMSKMFTRRERVIGSLSVQSSAQVTGLNSKLLLARSGDKYLPIKCLAYDIQKQSIAAGKGL